ncbi:MAG: ComF family protein [Candidatus Berkelbacteria bacterium]|nr:ComF family protein [Candidatus Berkelbacteria bacterium]
MAQVIKSISEFCLDLIFPKKCVNCGEFGSFCCQKCLAKIKPIQTQVCPKCGKISDLGKWCAGCKRDSNLTGIIVGATYRVGPTKEMIHYLKYNSVKELSQPLADLLIDQLIEAEISDKTITTSVPLHKKKYLERGYNQSEIMAKIVAAKLGLNYQNLLIRKRYDKKSQVELKGDARRKNLVDAFALCPMIDISGQTIFIVDDVSTTGTTLEECAKVLRDGGARRIYGLVVARG